MSAPQPARTKIVATLGPATSAYEVIKALTLAGVDVFRINMSHGSRQEHVALFTAVRAVEADTKAHLALLVDLCGPKIRIGRFVGGGPVQLTEGARVALVAGDREGTATELSVAQSSVLAELRPGAPVLLDDGRLQLRVLEVDPMRVVCEVVDGGPLGERKGLSSPGIGANIPSLTEKDREDLKWAVEAGADLMALSFVRKAHDIRVTKALLASLGADTPVLAKIEKPEAMTDLDAILEACDGVMVARGDLALETSIESVPIYQKDIIRRANAAAKPVITATEMLQSMTDNPRPTRAEATDVANAVLDGTDAVMLSSETSVGRYPVETVRIMERIIHRTEDTARIHDVRAAAAATRATGPERDTMAVAAAGAIAAEEIGAGVIAVMSATGGMARAVAALRPRARIHAFTASDAVARRLAVVWGVRAVSLGAVESLAEGRWRASGYLQHAGAVKTGDHIVAISGKGLEEAVAARMEVIIV
jgi:pyruvate kinase